MVRLTQMKWNGTVSHSAKTSIATRFRTVKAPHATSSQTPPGSSRRSRSSGPDTVPLAADGGDRLRAELRSKAAHVDVDDVGPGIEAVAPDVREEAFLRNRLPRVLHELS